MEVPTASFILITQHRISSLKGSWSSGKARTKGGIFGYKQQPNQHYAQPERDIMDILKIAWTQGSIQRVQLSSKHISKELIPTPRF